MQTTNSPGNLIATIQNTNSFIIRRSKSFYPNPYADSFFLKYKDVEQILQHNITVPDFCSCQGQHILAQMFEILSSALET